MSVQSLQVQSLLAENEKILFKSYAYYKIKNYLEIYETKKCVFILIKQSTEEVTNKKPVHVGSKSSSAITFG